MAGSWGQRGSPAATASQPQQPQQCAGQAALRGRLAGAAAASSRQARMLAGRRPGSWGRHLRSASSSCSWRRMGKPAMRSRRTTVPAGGRAAAAAAAMLHRRGVRSSQGSQTADMMVVAMPPPWKKQQGSSRLRCAHRRLGERVAATGRLGSLPESARTVPALRTLENATTKKFLAFPDRRRPHSGASGRPRPLPLGSLTPQPVLLHRKSRRCDLW